MTDAPADSSKLRKAGIQRYPRAVPEAYRRSYFETDQQMPVQAIEKDPNSRVARLHFPSRCHDCRGTKQAGDAMTATLYSYEQSGNSYKIRLLAALLDIKLDVVEIDFIGDEQHGEKFLAINPRGEVPTLVDGGRTLRDSASILVYLAGKHAPRNTWWSEDVAEQAAIVDWLAFASSWVQYGVFTARAILSFKGPYNGLGTTSNETSLREATIRGVKSLEILDTALEHSDWLALDRPTIADIAVFVYVALAPMGDISLEPYPAVRAWIERIKTLPRFFPIAGLDDPRYRRRAA